MIHIRAFASRHFSSALMLSSSVFKWHTCFCMCQIIIFYVKLWHSSCAYQNMIHVRSFPSVLFQLPYMLHPSIFQMPYMVLPMSSIIFYVKCWHSSCAYQNMIHVSSFASVHFSNVILVASGHFSNAIHGSACAKYHILRQIMTHFLCLLEYDPGLSFVSELFSDVMYRLNLFQ